MKEKIRVTAGFALPNGFCLGVDENIYAFTLDRGNFSVKKIFTLEKSFIDKIPIVRGLNAFISIWRMMLGIPVTILLVLATLYNDIFTTTTIIPQNTMTFIIGILLSLAIIVVNIFIIVWAVKNKSMFAWHGMEHKVANLIESEKSLTIENLKKSSRIHPRCGSNLVVWILLIDTILFIIGLRLTSTALFIGLPVAYEIFRTGLFVKFFSRIIQPLVTREPHDDYYEVGLYAANFLMLRHNLKE